MIYVEEGVVYYHCVDCQIIHTFFCIIVNRPSKNRQTGEYQKNYYEIRGGDVRRECVNKMKELETYYMKRGL